MRNLPRLLLVGPVVLLPVVAGCGDDDDTGGSAAEATSTTGQEHGCAVAEGGEVTIVAEDLAWDVDCIQAPEGLALTITVENRDAEVNHNLHITGLPGGPTTALQAGPATSTLALTAEQLTPGDHAYVCDVHPNMTGALEVLEPLAEGPTTTQG